MARKSRKETVVLPAPEIDATCRAGIYVRLSVEDMVFRLMPSVHQKQYYQR